MAKTKVRGGGKPNDKAVEEKPKKGIPKIEHPQIERAQMERMLRVGCSTTIDELESLLTSFLSELEPHVNGMDKKTRESAEKEKLLIKQRLIFFNSTYRDIPEPKRNLNYLAKMSDLLAHYVGVEVLASADPPVKGVNKSKDSEDDVKREEKNLISRIITALYTFLDSSEDHILDTMMKLKAPLEKNTPKKDIYSKLFRIIFNKAQKRQVNDLTYMRYLLVVRLWMRMMNTQRKEKVIKMVSKRLWPPPGFVEQQWAVLQIFPKPLKNTLNITEFFLREKFNVRKTIKKFLTVPSNVTHQSTMFLNLSCDPRLLNPKIRQSRPMPGPDTPIQEFSTLESTADDVWQRLHGPPVSQSSIFEQVTNLKWAKKCTANRMFNVLHSHHLQLKARKAEAKKLPKGRSVMGSHRAPCTDAYGISPPKASNGVNGGSPSARTKKRRILESPDALLHKKSKSDGHMPVHPSYVAGSLRKDNAQLAMVSPFTENPPPLEETTETIMKPDKMKTEVKEEPSGWQSGSSCGSGQVLDGQHPPKLAIENAVEETLQELQKSKPTPLQMAPPDVSPVKSETSLPLDIVDGARANPEVVPDCLMWGHLGQQELSSGDDVWLDDWLASYPSSACPEGQDFWAMIATDDIVDYS